VTETIPGYEDYNGTESYRDKQFLRNFLRQLLFVIVSIINKACNGKKAIAHLPAYPCIFILHYWIYPAGNSCPGHDHNRHCSQRGFDPVKTAGSR
jgi:hypothetical protein